MRMFVCALMALCVACGAYAQKAPPNHPEWPKPGVYDPNQPITSGEFIADIDGDGHKDFEYATNSGALKLCCATNFLKIPILYYKYAGVLIHRCPFNGASNPVEEYEPEPGGTTRRPKWVHSLEGYWSRNSNGEVVENPNGTDRNGNGIIEKMRYCPVYPPGGSGGSTAGGTPPVGLDIQYYQNGMLVGMKRIDTPTNTGDIPWPWDFRPNPNPEPANTPVLAGAWRLLMIGCCLVGCVILYLFQRRRGSFSRPALAVFVIALCLAMTSMSACVGEVSSHEQARLQEEAGAVNAGGMMNARLVSMVPPDSALARRARGGAAKSDVDLSDIELLIKHNYSTAHPAVPDPGLHVRVRDSIGQWHSGHVSRTYDWILPGQTTYWIAKLGNNTFVIRLGNTSYHYFRLVAATGGDVTWIADTDSDVQFADQEDLWIERYATVEPAPSTVVWEDLPITGDLDG